MSPVSGALSPRLWHSRTTISDDYFWRPTNPPYEEKREVAEILHLMGEVFLNRAGWVLSGGIEGWGDSQGWGDSIIPLLDLVVFVYTPTEVRLQRLRDRDARQFGIDAVAAGGWRHKETEEFIEWASHYDDGSREGRSLARQRAWLSRLPCRIIQVDGARPRDELVQQVIAVIV